MLWLLCHRVDCLLIPPRIIFEKHELFERQPKTNSKFNHLLCFIKTFSLPFAMAAMAAAAAEKRDPNSIYGCFGFSSIIGEIHCRFSYFTRWIALVRVSCFVLMYRPFCVWITMPSRFLFSQSSVESCFSLTPVLFFFISTLSFFILSLFCHFLLSVAVLSLLPLAFTHFLFRLVGSRQHHCPFSVSISRFLHFTLSLSLSLLRFQSLSHSIALLPFSPHIVPRTFEIRFVCMHFNRSNVCSL